MEKYNHKKIEAKWQKIWENDQVVKIDKDDIRNKFYMLDMFPYPSGEGLHMGHTESYTASDVLTRFKTMQGFNVLHPQGFDAFGLPAENYAIKTGIDPKTSTAQNISNFIGQMKSLGLRYDFDEKVVTYEPEYYKWTQWLFGKFFENDLVYKKTSRINWCESCQTGIANEQVLGGECERCGTQIVQKEIPSWFFKMTDFADALIDDLETVDWPEHTKKNQKNWIGKSEGARIKFQIKFDWIASQARKDDDGRWIASSQASRKDDDGREDGSVTSVSAGPSAVEDDSEAVQKEIEVFTTRPDTLFGATYMVLAPEHPLVQDLVIGLPNKVEVEKYILESQKKTEMDRIEGKEKTGVKLEGVFAINPAIARSEGFRANQEEIPIFVADYVLSGYGTGAIMAVPAHDERDNAFAIKYKLPIKEVIVAKENQTEEIFVGEGVLVNSGQFDGLDSEGAKKKITEFVGGEPTTNYRLRDWSMSRQRYWGCPIPIVYSPEGEVKLIPEEHLPWLLPTDVDFVPSGKSPLEKSVEFRERTEKIFGKGWTPEFDTMDTFVDSSWYFLRYPDVHNEKEFCSESRKQWLPVDLYIGGAEHTYMHLLFARFFVKAMHKIGLINFNEPFLKLRHQGMVLDGEGKKMSKSKGNVTNPDEMVERFGADSTRTYMLFAAPLEDEVMWNEDNIVGVYRFLEKVFYQRNKLEKESSKEVQNFLHKTIKKVGDDINSLKYNTAVSEMMKLLNVVKNSQISQDDFEKFLKILAPFAPHITEEIWENLGHKSSIHLERWPDYDAKLAQDDLYTIAIQVNGKVRAEIEVGADILEDELKNKAFSDPQIMKWIGGNEIKKTVYIKNKILNIVV